MNSPNSGLLVLTFALVLACGSLACSRAPQVDDVESSEVIQTESAGEPAVTEGGSEARAEKADEHGEGGEARNSGEHGEGGEAREGGEHEGEEASGHDEGGEGEEGEEGGVYIERGDTWDTTRRGARLVLTFDPASNAFSGTVENTTKSSLCAVRVEVHLSSGTELGPTERTDLPAGQSTEVELPTGGVSFDTWTAHPEVSPCSGE
jgi:hypothetical protein